MAKDVTGVIKSLQASAVGRCRERLEDAAERARGLISHERSAAGGGRLREPEHGVTTVLKRRHGL